MANNINLIEKWLPNALDTVLRTESKTAILRTDPKWLDLNFTNAATIRVASILMDGLGNYKRVNNVEPSAGYTHGQFNGNGGVADGYPKKNVSLTWQEYTLPYDRGAQFQIDEMDNEETAGLALAGLTTEFNRVEVVPETDALLFSDIAKKTSTSLGNINEIAGAIAANTIINEFLKAFKYLNDMEVPEEDQVLFISTDVDLLMQTSNELTRFLKVTEYRENDVSYKITTFQGRPVIVVPPSRFFTNVILGENGYYAGSDAKAINFMVVAKGAVIPIVKLAKFKVYGPEVVQDFDGYKVNYRIYHGNFIPKNKQMAVYCDVSNTNANTQVGVLNVLTAAGTTTNAYVVEEIYTKPYGINYANLVYSATAFTLGAEKEIDGSDVKLITLGAENVEASATTGYFALLDANGIVVATTPSAVPLNKKGA